MRIKKIYTNKNIQNFNKNYNSISVILKWHCGQDITSYFLLIAEVIK